MKRSQLSLLAICFVFITNLHAQINYGFKAGFNASTMTLKVDGVGLNPKAVLGFHAGFFAELQANDQFSIQPGLLVSTKGSKYHLPGDELDLILSPTVIEVPVNGLLKFSMGSAKFLAFAGPYLSYAIGGTYYLSDGKDEGSENLSFGEGEEKDMKPFDIGFNFGAGIEINQIQFSIQYNLGLNNLAPVTTNKAEMKNRSTIISVGYLFYKRR